MARRLLDAERVWLFSIDEVAEELWTAKSIDFEGTKMDGRTRSVPERGRDGSNVERDRLVTETVASTRDRTRRRALLRIGWCKVFFFTAVSSLH